MKIFTAGLLLFFAVAFAVVFAVARFRRRKL
jgi:hypothetical protein